MKNIVLGAVLALTGVFALSYGVQSVVAAANLVTQEKAWGMVGGVTDSKVYRLMDEENGVMCYFAYMDGQRNVIPDMECVKVVE